MTHQISLRFEKYAPKICVINRPTITAVKDVPVESNEVLELQNDLGAWSLRVERTAVMPDAQDWTIHLSALRPVDDVSVCVRLPILDWSRDGFLLMPGAVYDGNRFHSERAPYPPTPQPRELTDTRPVIGDIPRLDLVAERSQIDLLAGDLSSPAVGVYLPKQHRGVWLFTDAQTDVGTTGLSFVERLDESRGEIIARFPGVRRYKYWLCDTLRGSNDRPASWTTGQSLILRVRTVEFTCQSRQEIFDRFAHHRQTTVRRNSTPPSVIPLSAAFDVIADKYDRQNWVELEENCGYYAVGTDHENPYGSWQPGWVGGGMSTLALIELGNEKSIERSIKTLEFAFTRGLAKGGLPYGLSDGKKFYGDQFASPQAPWHLIRKSGDLLFYAVQQIRLLKQLGRTFPDTIRSGAMTLAGALETVWRRNGQLGQFVNHDTLDVIVPGSTSGAIVPAALALAAQEFDRPDWLNVAVYIADQYWRLDGETCVQTGAAGEIMQAPDCEAAVALLESFVTLYERTNDRRWLDRATRLAVQCLTWQFAYDFEFPKGTLFEKLGIRTRGGWLASVQNIGPCPAMCSHSGASLLRLFRYTGDERFMNMLTDNTRVVTQYLSTEERPIGNQQPGWISERIATTDAINDLGTIFDGSCWPETSVLLMAAELPSVYVRRDLRRVWSLDVIEAELQKDGNLRLTNPTKMTAKVRICFETPETVANTSFHSLRPTWTLVHLPAGDTMDVAPT